MTDKKQVNRLDPQLDDDSYSELEENDQMTSNMEESKSLERE